MTKALVRYIDVPGVAGEVALITLDNGLDHTRPSTFGPAGLASLDAALDDIEAHTPRVAAIAVTGKPFIFAVGADISGVPSIHSREQALEIGQLGHRVFRRFADSAVPTFAFVNGAVMGGGLELALHCHYRTLAARPPPSRFRRCSSGSFPAGAARSCCPDLIGPKAAVKVIIENALNQNKMLTPAQAAELGVVDVLLDAADFLPQSLAWAGRVLDGSSRSSRPDRAGDDWDAAVAARAGRSPTRKIHGAAPAPYRALELIALARTADFTTGTAAEDEALADLIMSDELRSSLYAFDLVNKRAKRPAGAPDKALARPVTKVGVVGAGLMAEPAGVAVRAPARGAGRDDRPRPGSASTRASATCTTRSTSCWPRDASTPTRPTGSTHWSAVRSRRTRSPTPTSSSRPSSRRSRSRSRSSPRSRSTSGPRRSC